MEVSTARGFARHIAVNEGPLLLAFLLFPIVWSRRMATALRNRFAALDSPRHSEKADDKIEGTTPQDDSAQAVPLVCPESSASAEPPASQVPATVAPDPMVSISGAGLKKNDGKEPPPFDYYAIVDFECTCERNQSFNHEIIEFPVVFLNARTLQVDMEFRRYVRPAERPILTAFCTQLTGITQAAVDAADLLEDVLGEFHEFLRENSFVCSRRDRGPGRPLFVMCTDGPWDVLRFLRPECQRKRLPLEPYWERWIDLRRAFFECYGPPQCGLARMLDRCGLRFEGRQHCGLDDARNIARIACEILTAGQRLVPDNH